MNCFEYEGKALFKEYGIRVPKGINISSEADIYTEMKDMEMPLVIKAQVLSGKRGKAGGIAFINSEEELIKEYERVKKMSIYGEQISSILIEEKLDIEKELYLGVTLDPVLRSAVLLFCPEGGIDIEEISLKYPEKLLRSPIKSDYELFRYYDLFSNFELENSILVQLSQIAFKLVKLFFSMDCTTVEVNPLIIDSNGVMVAADSKIVIDDNALFRHPRFSCTKGDIEKDPLMQKAKEHDLAFVPLESDGFIGSIAGGAGLGMATVDIIRLFGVPPANFLDVGGGVSEERMFEAVRLVMSIPSVKGLLINVFGGINNCAVMADGIARAWREGNCRKKIVVKMRGHSQEKGWKTLENIKIPVIKYGTTEDAVSKLLSLLDVKEDSVNDHSC